MLLPGRKGKINRVTEQTWSVQKAPLGQFMWDDKCKAGHLKFRKNLPVEVDCGDLNPTLSFLLYPFGLFDDRSLSMTLQIKVNIPDDCPPLLPTDTFTLSWAIHTQATKTMPRRLLTCAKKPLKIQFDRGMLYIFRFLPHDIIKPCECRALEIYVTTSYQCRETSASADGRFQDLGTAITPKQTGITRPINSE